MKKTLKLISLSLIILLVIVGCNNTPDEEVVENDITENQDEETTNDAENDNSNETSDSEEGSISTSHDLDSSDSVLGLGETGVMETAIGDYELTVLSFEFIDGPEEHLSGSQMYLAVDINIKNIGTDVIDSEDVANATITDSESGGRPNETAIDIVDHFEGTIAPGEEQSGQLLFRFREEDTYHLKFGANHLDSLTNELTWEFTLEESQ